ncbi:MAG: GIY-YIG nuclease family protein [Clostridia bacterium]|nr:GIY-YIG nuclease family protein [Clostridia bacterium]
MFYVYILRCADDSLYCGYTTDVEKRFEKHKSGKGAKYTRSHLPLEIVYIEEFENKSDALKREHEIKSMTRLQKEKLVSLYHSEAGV